MSTNRWTIEVANPSPYERSDYVQIDLNELGVPPELDEKTLTLYPLSNNNRGQEIAFQIDYPFGEENGTRIMTFSSANTPQGWEDYGEKNAAFQLLGKKTEQVHARPDLRIDHHYEDPLSECDRDGYDRKWEFGRPAQGVKLNNGTLEVYFKFKPSLSPAGLSYTGAAANVFSSSAAQSTTVGEMLHPYNPFFPEKLWGQVTELVFFPLPWEHKWFHRVSLRDQEYGLVWSKSGPIRAIVTLKSKPFTILYNGSPFFSEKAVEVKANFYRVIYVYPGQNNPYYTEELFVLTEEGRNALSFRPYYFSKVPPESCYFDLKRFEHIPDYFVLWKHFGPHHYGYGFAADVHVRWVQIKGDEIRWRLPLSRNCRCIHYFMFQPSHQFDPFHDIGHKAWYERAFKPLQPSDFSLRFPPHLEYYEE